MYKLGFNTQKGTQCTYLWALYPTKTITANGKDGAKQNEDSHTMALKQQILFEPT